MKKPNPREEGEGEGGDTKAAMSCVTRNKETKQRSEAVAEELPGPQQWPGQGPKLGLDLARSKWKKQHGYGRCTPKKGWETDDLTGLYVPGGGPRRADGCPVIEHHGKRGSDWREERKMWILGDVSGPSAAVKFTWREATKLHWQLRAGGRVGKQRPGEDNTENAAHGKKKNKRQRGQGKMLSFWATAFFTLLGPGAKAAGGQSTFAGLCATVKCSGHLRMPRGNTWAHACPLYMGWKLFLTKKKRRIFLKMLRIHPYYCNLFFRSKSSLRVTMTTTSTHFPPSCNHCRGS